METILQNIGDFLTENAFGVAYLIMCLVVGWFIGAWIGDRKTIKELRGENKILKDCQVRIDKGNKMLADKCVELQKENAHILKVNQGLCQRKEAIVKEITNELYYRSVATKKALALMSRGENFYKPKEVTEYFNEFYHCLTGNLIKKT
jgi:hypothetical protein